MDLEIEIGDPDTKIGFNQLKSADMRPDIIFLFPGFNGRFSFHLGVGYIIAYLRQKGIYAEQFCGYESLGLKELVEDLLKKKPGMVGFTCYDRNYFLVKLISKHIKIIKPDILIIVGGPTATFSDEVILKNIPEVDLCIRGEGEYATYEIIQQFWSNRNFSKILGITYRNRGKIIRTADRPFIKGERDKDGELDILPSPYLNGVIDPYQLIENKDHVSIITSRGCPHRCTYCNFAIMSGHNVRYHSVDRIISELKVLNRLLEYKEDFVVTFDDDTFTLNKNRTKEICQRIIKEGIDLNFDILTRGDCVDHKILKLLYKAGIRQISFGLESAVPRVLYNIKKVRFGYRKKDKFKPERRFIRMMKKSIKCAKKIGFKIGLGVIFGLPGETFHDGLKTINLVKKLRVDTYAHNFLNLYAGTEMFKNFVKNKSNFSESRFRLASLALKKSSSVDKNVYKYNVRKIPRLENDHNFKDKILCLSRISKALIGLYKQDIIKKRYLNDIVLITDKISSQWVIKDHALRTNFIFGDNLKNLMFQREGMLKIITFPLAKLLSLKTYEKNIYFNKIIKEYNEVYKNHFIFKNFSSFMKCKKDDREKRDTIFSISNYLDIDELERQLTLIREEGVEQFFAKIHFDYFLIDGCRWAKNCPAICLQRIIVDRNFNVLPCFQGKPIGKVGDNLGKLRKNMIGYYKREEKKRGCEKCPVKDNCSKCPFLDGIDRDRYCEIKRKYSSTVNDFINLINSKRKLKYATHSLFDK